MENEIIIHRSLIKKNSPDDYRIFIPYTDIREEYQPYMSAPASLVYKTEDGNYVLDISDKSVSAYTAYRLNYQTATRESFQISKGDLVPLFDSKIKRLAFENEFIPGADVMELMDAADMLGFYLKSSENGISVFANRSGKVRIEFNNETGVKDVKIGKVRYERGYFKDKRSDTDIYIMQSGKVITADMMADRLLTENGIDREIHSPEFIKGLGPTLPDAHSPIWESNRINAALYLKNRDRLRRDILPMGAGCEPVGENDVLLIRDEENKTPSAWKIEEYDDTHAERMVVRLIDGRKKYEPTTLDGMYRKGKAVVTGYIHKGKRIRTEGFNRICEGKTPGEIKNMDSQEERAVKRAQKAINMIKKAESITLPLEERINLARSLTGRKPRTDGSGGVR